MPCSACGGGKSTSVVRGTGGILNFGFRGCGSYYYFRRRRMRRRRR